MWPSPTYNSALVGNALKVFLIWPPLPLNIKLTKSRNRQTDEVSPTSASGPQGGTHLFSHHVLSTMGVECPASSRESAWRTAFFRGADFGGRAPLPALSESERARRAAAAENAWRVFVDRDAPKRLQVLGN